MPVYKLKPACTDYIWGGTKLRDEYNIEYDKERLAEAWVLSCHPSGTSVIVSGDAKGQNLNEYIQINGKAVLGSNCDRLGDFPIIAKLIDAKKDLSIQVHPNNYYAHEFEGQLGKTEMWYVVDAEPDSFIFYGVKRNVTVEEVRRHIEDETLTEILNAVPAHKGDVFYIPAGTMHAIGKGLLIAEVQQNSNVTYRVFDYGRTDDNGNKRELHVEKALSVIRCKPNYTTYDFGGHLVSCKYFITDIIKGSKIDFVDERSFVSYVVLDGEGKMSFKNQKGESETFEIRKGESFFAPASTGRVLFEGDKLEILRTQV